MSLSTADRSADPPVRRKPIINPHAELEAVRGEGEVQAVRVWAPVRGKSLHYWEISADRYPRAFHTLATAIANDGRLPNVDVADARELRDLGVLIYPSEVSEPVTFEIPPLEMAEASARAARAFSGVVSPSFPLPMPEKDLAAFAGVISQRDSVVWQQANEIGVVNPWAISDEPAHASVQESLPEPQDDFNSAATEAAELFAKRGYAAVRLDLPHAQLAALQRYFASLVDNGWLQLRDQQSNRFFVHNDPVAVMLQWRMLPLIRRIARANVKPSYAYTIRYLRGAELPKHTDREQCKYTVALLLDLEGSDADVSPWPLTLYPGEGQQKVDIHQAVGEALMYFGQTIAHARVALDSCRSSTSILLHYVDEAFTGTLL